ncbi:hypothetical protein [Frigidibacter sp. MR17.24]|uniref:hypothetical protein n=1 Tax=Frigidibacter sp. MR17.24 TaxID=3127345 RepID=UPI003012C0F1
MQIFQSWLDRVGQTFFDNDFDAYADTMALPFIVMTTRRTMIITDRETLHEGFDAFRHLIRNQRATDLFRVATDVYPIGGAILSGCYETHLLRGGQRLIEAYRSSALLRREADGIWRASCIANAMSNRSWPIRAPRIEANDAPLEVAPAGPDWQLLAREKLQIGRDGDQPPAIGPTLAPDS